MGRLGPPPDTTTAACDPAPRRVDRVVVPHSAALEADVLRTAALFGDRLWLLDVLDVDDFHAHRRLFEAVRGARDASGTLRLDMKTRAALARIETEPPAWWILPGTPDPVYAPQRAVERLRCLRGERDTLANALTVVANYRVATVA